MGWAAIELGGLAIAFMAMAAQPAAAAQPSFDCDKAKSEVERLICGDEVLADLDLRLAKDFAQALSHASADQVPGLRSAQKSWRTQMLKCAQTPDPRGCTLQAYTRRIDQL